MWYDDEVVQGVLTHKYLHEGEKTFEDLVTRVSSIYSESIREDVKTALMKGELCPAGRTLYGAGMKGKGLNLSLSNCYVSRSLFDDLKSIGEVDYEMSKIGSMGGGIGVALDNIRPRGAKINNSAKVSEGVGFCLHKFNNTGEHIGQGNRKMAIMVMLNCNHPDIYEFLHIKENNEKLSAMNISIKMTDEFMEAVRDNKPYELYFKVEATGEEIRRTINARDFFNEFCQVNVDYGDPGICFIDRVQKYHLLSGYDEYKIETSNPCVTGDTLILTDDGYKRIDSVVGQSVNVWNGYQFSKVTPKITGHNQKIKRISVSNGMTLDCTEYHKFVLEDGSRVEAKNLKIGDRLKKWKYPVVEGTEDLTNAYTKGFYSGDGTKGRSEIVLYGVKQELLDRLAYRGFYKRSNDSTLVRLVEEDVFEKDFVPTSTYTVKARLAWLAGLIDSDGCKNGNESGGISIASVDRDFLSRVQLMLTTLGVSSTVSLLHEAGEHMLPKNDGTDESALYMCKDCYRLTISLYNVRKLFDLGLTLYRVKLDCAPNRDASRFITITSIEDISDAETVYCFNEPINHTGVFNGIMTAQCSEFFAIEGNSCNLGSINLYSIVNNKFSDMAEIDWGKFEYLIRTGVRMLDETLDYGYDMQPLDLHRKCIDDWRSIGLGVFGLADMFVAMKIKYGSKESIRVVSDIFDFMNKVALDESCNLAREKGTFGKYDWEKMKKSPIIQALQLDEVGKEVYDRIEQFGLRNGTLIVIAPTGSLSLLMGKLSGGVEPLFKLWYDRTTHAGEDKGVVFRVFSRAVEDLLKYHNIDPNSITIEQAKEKFDWLVESHDIEPMDRISVQSVMQEYADGAISSTINLPAGTTADTVFDIFMKAWEQRVKGLTVFVDGCKRGNILGVDNEKKKETSAEVVYDSIMPVSRRDVDVVNGQTFRLSTACVHKMYLTINKTDEGDVFEVFANPSGGCVSNINTICRLVSMALRSGVKVEEIIHELGAMKCPACQALRKKGEEVELSCGNAIAKALQQAYNKKDKEEEDNKDDGLLVCPECGERTLRLEAKCCVCPCGYSRCE